MDERERIEKRIRDQAEGSEDERLCRELFEAACRGLEEGSSGGAVAEVKKRVDLILEEIKEIAARIEAKM